MKRIAKIITCCCFVFFATGLGIAQNTPGDRPVIQAAPSKDTVKPPTPLQTPPAKADSTGKTKPPNCTDCSKPLNDQQVFLVFTPLGLLLLVAIIFIIWIRSSNFSLKDALSVAPSPQLIAEVAKLRAEAAQQAALANTTPPNIPDPPSQGSVSRLLAFITGIIAIVIAICLVSYHAYAVFAGCGSDNLFTSLWKILAGLGIGVIPYGINVWNGNAKEKDQTTPKS